MGAMGMMRGFLGVLAAACALAAQAQMAGTTQQGFYVAGAIGGNHYDYDCWFWVDCSSARSTMGKFGVGYRFGPFGVEGWGIDFGNANTDAPQESLRLRALAVNGVWYLPLAPNATGLLRAGVAEVNQTRTRDVQTSAFSGTFGLGLLIGISPALALELAWDVTGGEGTNSGSTTANALSVGLRASF